METFSKLDDGVPIGTHKWVTGSENALCGRLEGYTTEMTFSKCYPNKYTCNSGHCINLHQKCDTDIDCKDKSDEQNCQYLRLGLFTFCKIHLLKPCLITFTKIILLVPDDFILFKKCLCNFFVSSDPTYATVSIFRKDKMRGR